MKLHFFSTSLYLQKKEQLRNIHSQEKMYINGHILYIIIYNCI